ncbi:phosphoserine phosphatase [Methylophaga lonarensis MPL]|uniref:Phosphoserine phosphatase n=1 Tax=Methylophaga lonarensis MPL TaxID=1286106 RepID=M7PV05_9GAMM|nr:phosphoserine phosphatase SerB [Methylophaga lonarensis]EMR14264.1 phosphoserine phosphatase [Methylophaga lonarensis MPL]
MNTMVLQGAGLTVHAGEAIARQLAAEVKAFENFVVLHFDSANMLDLDALRQEYSFDINLLPGDFLANQAKLLVMDMDSTLISIECIDEIADFMNLKPQVSEITESAMRGEIDFETSLRSRVSLLKGLPVSVLEQVYQQRLKLNPGAELMISTLKNHNIKTALVSGGFTFFTERLQQRLGLDYTMANVLAEHDGKLTGEVVGDVCGAESKAQFLLRQCEELGIAPSQALAMGDGANDLLMMAEAGLSIAYHAKPKVQKQASTVLNHCGLEGVLGLLHLDFSQA